MSETTQEVIVQSLLCRLGDADFDQFQDDLRATGFCSHPITLSGSGIRYFDSRTGEVVGGFVPGPEGIKVPCGNRRRAKCRGCSDRRAAAEFHAIVAGLQGRDGSVPSSVSSHPRAFLTLTQPGAGSPIHHVNRASGVCHPATHARGSLCPHGTRLVCGINHREDDRILGTPLCAECLRYPQVIIGNALVPKLWTRFTQNVRREMARVTGISCRQTAQLVSLSYSKIAEGSRSGAIHLHAVARLDARRLGDEPVTGPPAPFDESGLLVAALRVAAARTRIDSPTAQVSGPLDGSFGFGTQTDISLIACVPPLATGQEAESNRGRSSVQAAAGYTAKYISKSFFADHQPTPGSALTDSLAEHYDTLARTCVRLSRRPELSGLRLDERVEAFGYPSRPSSRSRAYSVTLAQLRAEQQQYRAQRAGSPLAAEHVVAVPDLAFTGSGWAHPGDRFYAQQRAAQYREELRLARDARQTST